MESADKEYKKMKAAALTGRGRIEVREVAEPILSNAANVLIRVEAAGICGSDVHYYSEGRIGDQVVEYPFVVGHECAGVVLEVGTAVTRLKPGDRVAIAPAIVCGQCDQCLAGRPNTCRNLRFLGTPGQMPGCLSEVILMPEQNCHLLSEGMSMNEGALMEPLSIGVYSLRLLAGCLPERIAILGSGPIGLSVLLAAKAAGVRIVCMTDKIEERVRAARRAGADWSGNPEKSDIVARLRALEPGLLDAVFECCGDQAALDQAVDLLRPGGKLLVVGIPVADRVSFDVHKLRRKEISILSVRRQKHCFSEAIQLIKNNKADVRFMATHEFTLTDSAKAFELVSGYGDGVIKAIIRPSF
jgi:L-iditol 2-dehydrogenase